MNCAYRGALLYVRSISNRMQNIWIESCIFKNNTGFWGSGINLSKEVKIIKATIKGNYFIKNIVNCKIITISLVIFCIF